MKLKDQVTRLELSKKLKELGVKQGGVFWWLQKKLLGVVLWELESDKALIKIHRFKKVSAFTVAELGRLLPSYIKDDDGVLQFLYTYKDDADFWRVLYRQWGATGSPFETQKEQSEADARAIMLIYLIENKLYEQ